MKNKKKLNQQTQMPLLIGFLFLSTIANAASYDLTPNTNKTIQPSLNRQLNINSLKSFLNPQYIQANNNPIQSNFFNIIKLITNDKLEAAENEIKNLLLKTPNESSLYNLRALLHIAKNDKENALLDFKKTIELDSHSFSAHIALAKIYLERNNNQQAEYYALKADSINSNSVYALLILADIAKKQNKLEAVERILLAAQNRSYGIFKEEAIVTTNLIKLYAVLNQPKKALSLGQRFVKNYPDNNYSLTILANTGLIIKRKDIVEQALFQLVSLEKKDIKYRLQLLSMLIDQQTKEKKALVLINELLSISPKNTQILTINSFYLTKLKHYKQAIALAHKVQSLKPKTGQGKVLEADINLAQRYYGQALSLYKEAYKIKKNSNVLSSIVDIMNKQGNKLEAITLLKEELNKDSKNMMAHFKLANFYQQQNNIPAVEKHYQSILKEEPNNTLVLNNLAWLYFQQSNPKALSLAKKAYELNSNSIEIADTYGSILFEQGSVEQAIVVLEKASQLDKSIYNVQFHLAKAYSRKGYFKKAQGILSHIIKTGEFSEKNAAIDLLNKLN